MNHLAVIRHAPLRSLILSFAVSLGVLAFGLVAAQEGEETGAAGEETGADTATNGDAPVIRLDDTVVTGSDFDERFGIVIRGISQQQGIPFDESLLAQFESLKPQFLEQLVDQVVLLGEAETRGITISDEEIDQQLEQTRQGFPDEATFTQALNQAGFADEAQFRNILRETETVQRTAEAISEEIEVTDDEVESFYDENQAQFEQPEQVCSRHILVETEEEANEILAELEGGAEFATLAQERSIDPGSGQQGGDLGCVGRGQFVPEFEEAAFAGELGEVTDPVESQFGFHLIVPYERQEAETQPLEEVRDTVREQLQGQQLQTRVTELREASGVEVFPENIPATAVPEGAPEVPLPEPPGEGTGG